MKKIITLLLCLLLIAALAVTVFAAGSASFSVSTSGSTLYRGDTVTLTVQVSSSEPATSYGLQLSYDASVLELVSGSCTVPEALVNSFNNGFAFMFQNATAYSGTVGTVTFRVKDTAAFGSYVITGDASVKNGNAVVSANGCSVSHTVACKHSYGSWTMVSDTQHKHICSICQKEETVNHTYDNACDTDCNVCGATRTTSHNYKTVWSKDKTSHWHECSVCKDKKDVEKHTPGAEATETKAQTCTVCGYVIKAALGHKHSYASTWTTDESGHWYACSGCEEKGSYAEHDFENACDPDCSICGYTRETAHSFAEEWDENSHWHICTGCGLKADEGIHEPGAEATADTAQTCTICGYEIAPALGGSEETLPDATEPTNPDTPEDSSFPWWIVVVIAVVVIGGAVVFVVLKKKNSEE